MTTKKTIPDGSEISIESLFRLDEVAVLTGRSRRAVENDVKRGRLIVVRFGRSVRVRPEDFNAYLSAKGAARS
jgi:excisionase family DNA binding protein